MNMNIKPMCCRILFFRRGVSSINSTNDTIMGSLKEREFKDILQGKRSDVGLSEYLKKHRMYAQLNYKEWRYPPRQTPVNISCTPQILDNINNHDQGYMSSLKQPRTALQKQAGQIYSRRKIKKHVPDFHRLRFPSQAEKIYRETYTLLNSHYWTLPKQEETEQKLHELVTELAYPEMTMGLKDKTVSVNVLDNVEPPKTVSCMVSPAISSENWYGQVTVRFHTKQTVTMYDRFGRVLFGSPDLVRSVIEYIVFERHLTNPNGQWRIHGKLPLLENMIACKQTTSVIQSKFEVLEQKKWHEEQREICDYKWNTFRKEAMKKDEVAKHTLRNYAYWSKHRKLYVLNVHLLPKTRMFGPSQKRVLAKRNSVVQLRKAGKLPKPKKN